MKFIFQLFLIGLAAVVFCFGAGLASHSLVNTFNLGWRLAGPSTQSTPQ